MPQRIFSLEIGATELKAAVVQTSFGEQIKRFLAAHSQAGDTILSALPGDRVTWRTFFLPFRDTKKLAQTVPFEMESSVPFGLDEVVVDYQILRRDRAGKLVLWWLALYPVAPSLMNEIPSATRGIIGAPVLCLLAVLATAVLLAVTIGAHGGLTRTNAARAATPCSTVERIGVGLDLGLPLINTGARDRCDLTSGTTGELLAVAGWSLQLLAWAFATLFIAGFTGAVRKT